MRKIQSLITGTLIIAQMHDIRPAHVESDDSGTPYAPAFDDCYCSQKDALAEARYVFLDGNQLPHRWQNRADFTIAEAGFGTGLNFLTTWQAWRNDPNACETLHFISVEKHPVPRETLYALHSTWTEFADLSHELLAVYPPAVAGFHRLLLANGHITLTLCFADILDALSELDTSIDAWYLDGFSPAKNERMWSADVFQHIARLSKSDSTLATFTAAGQVRRDLQTAGFTVQKRKGFGKKREMLTARYDASTHTAKQQTYTANDTPWFIAPSPHGNIETACVIGGGVAGCQAAHALAQRGVQVTLLERHAQLAQEASGNLAGVITPKMTAEPGWGETFYRQAFLFAIRQIQQLERAGHNVLWDQCGALQLNHNQREQQRWQRLKTRDLPEDFIRQVSAEEASKLAGVNLPYAASYFPQGAWLNPASLCKALVQHPNIHVLKHTEALTLSQQHGHDWQIKDAQGKVLLETPIVVIANGKDAQQFSQTQHLPFMPVAGQTTLAPATETTAALKTTIGHEGYLTPVINGHHVFGATFERHQQAHLKTEADQSNLQQLQHHLADFSDQLLKNNRMNSGHAAVRMTTPNRYPYVGALPDNSFYQSAYHDLHHGRFYQHYKPAQYHTGLYISAGYGSRGLTTTAVCAEHLISVIFSRPGTFQTRLTHYLHPARFLIRELKRTENMT